LLVLVCLKSEDQKLSNEIRRETINYTARDIVNILIKFKVF